MRIHTYGAIVLCCILAACQSGDVDSPESQPTDSQRTDRAAPADATGDGVSSRGVGIYSPDSRPPTFTALTPGLGGAIACTKDRGDPQSTTGRDLDGYTWADSAMTNQRCRDGCATRGFVFSGTQYGSYCFCGATFGKIGPATNCDTLCSGNAGEICGGAWANSISLTGAEPPLPPVPANGAQCQLGAVLRELDGSGNVVRAYRHVEVQRWEVTGPAAADPSGKGYSIPYLWTTTGYGTFREPTGNGNANDYRWGVSAAHRGVFRQLPSGDSWRVTQAPPQVTHPTGVIEMLQQTVAGSVSAPTLRNAPAIEYQIGDMRTFGKTNLGFVGSGRGYQANRQPVAATPVGRCEATIALGR